MYKACKELLKKNNQRENEILDTNQEIYTNMIVYLRGADITEYRQEQIREDIIEMILDGQERGDDIEQIMGGNYQEICDEILEEVPKRTRKQKVLYALQIVMVCMWILGAIFVIQNTAMILGNGSKNYMIPITLGNLISWIFLVLVANVTVIYVSKTALQESKKTNRILECVGVLVVFAGVVLSDVFLTISIIKVHIAIAAIVVIAICLIERVVLATKDL